MHEAIKGLLEQGYAFPCAHCQRMWMAKATGQASCGPMIPDGKPCGGPMSGMSFPHYKGPLTQEFIAGHCFRCGADADSSIMQNGGVVGVCDKHLPLVDRLIPEQRLTKCSR